MVSANNESHNIMGCPNLRIWSNIEFFVLDVGGDMALKIQDLTTRNKGKPEVARDYFDEDQILYWFT